MTDLFCEQDITPRIELLIKHLGLLGVEISLRDSTHEPRSDPYLIIPKPFESQWQPTRTAPELTLAKGDEATNPRCVAIYLDAETRQIEANFHVAIPTWPARSSDRTLVQLAQYLRRPDLAILPATIETTTNPPRKHDAKMPHPAQRDNTDRNGRYIFVGLLAILIVVLFVPDEQQPSQQASNPQTPTSFNDIHVRNNQDIAVSIPTAVSTANPEQSKQKLPINDYANTKVEPNITLKKSTRQYRYCPTDAEVLKAVLTWQANTSFVTCHKFNATQLAQTQAASSNAKTTKPAYH